MRIFPELVPRNKDVLETKKDALDTKVLLKVPKNENCFVAFIFREIIKKLTFSPQACDR